MQSCTSISVPPYPLLSEAFSPIPILFSPASLSLKPRVSQTDPISRHHFEIRRSFVPRSPANSLLPIPCRSPSLYVDPVYCTPGQNPSPTIPSHTTYPFHCIQSCSAEYINKYHWLYKLFTKLFYGSTSVLNLICTEKSENREPTSHECVENIMLVKVYYGSYVTYIPSKLTLKISKCCARKLYNNMNVNQMFINQIMLSSPTQYSQTQKSPVIVNPGTGHFEKHSTWEITLGMSPILHIRFEDISTYFRHEDDWHSHIEQHEVPTEPTEIIRDDRRICRSSYKIR